MKSGIALARREGWASWIRSYADAIAVAEGCWIDAELGQGAVDFIQDYLKLWKGSEWVGRPFILLDWQRDRIVMPLFGWRRANGTRRFRRGFIFLPKKNGKSTLCSAIALCLFVLDQEAGAEVYCAATKREQARLVWKSAANMVEVSKDLGEVLVVRDHISTIEHPGLRGVLTALSSDAKSNEGLDIHGLIYDELHASTDRDFFDALVMGGASRRQPLFLTITTAGDNRLGVCYEEYEYACKVRDGAIDEWEYFALIYEAGKDDDWKDEATWRKANPGYDVTCKAEDFHREVREALEQPGKKANFRRRRLNIWVETRNPWMEIELWTACENEDLSMEQLEAA